MSGLCRVCARPKDVEPPAGCVCAGTAAEGWRPSRPPRAEPPPVWGSNAERRHMAKECDPDRCRYCETAALMRGHTEEGTG